MTGFDTGLRLDRSTVTTRHLRSAFPWHFDGGLLCPGPLIGVNLLAGRAPFTFDPFGLLLAELASNPNVIVAGKPGVGKSTIGKTVVWWCVGAFGYRFVAVDPKGEYRALADALGVSVIQLHPGGQSRVNPLASDRTEDGDRARLRFVTALASVLLGRSLNGLETAVLEDLVAWVAGTRTEPILADLLDALRDPPVEVCQELAKDREAILAGTDELRFRLRGLVTGAQAGMFNGHTTVNVDTSRGVVIDLSGTGTDDELLRLAMLAGQRAVDQLRGGSPGRTIMLNDETWRLGTTADTVRWLQHSWKLGRQHGTSNWALVHRLSDLGNQADDGTSLAKIGKGLVGDSDTHVLFRQGTHTDAEHACAELQLPPACSEVLTKLPKGRALIHCQGRLAVVDITLSATLEKLTYTNQAIDRQAFHLSKTQEWNPPQHRQQGIPSC